MQQTESAVGFVLDPDADRLALIDETGTCVSEELTLALAVKYRLRQQRGPVVINMSTSRMVEDIAREFGCGCHRSAVGEANVVGRMREVGAVIGGEGNGGVIDPRVGWVRDPFVGMAFILSLMAEERKPFSQLVAELPRYAMLKTKFEVPREKLAASLRGAREAVAGGEGQPRGRAAARRAGLVAARPRQQHRAGGPRDRRGADRGAGAGIVRPGGTIVTGKPAAGRAKKETTPMAANPPAEAATNPLDSHTMRPKHL